MFSSKPWFVWVTYFGLQISLTLICLPRLIKKVNGDSLKFLSIFLFAVLSVGLLFSYNIGIAFLGGVGSLYLFFLAFPLSCFAALALNVLVPSERKMNKTALTIESHSKIHLSKYKGKVFYVLSAILVFSMAASFLSYTYSIAIDYPKDRYTPRLSVSDADVLQWMHNSIDTKAVIIALSKSSYQMLCSFLPNEILPIYFGTGGPEGGSWIRNSIINSQVPEAVLNNLYRSGATHIFVSSADSGLSNSTFVLALLMKNFPITYASGEVKLYSIPTVLYEDSNYHIVTGLYDLPVKDQQFTLEEENSPVYIFNNDVQSAFWNITAMGEGTGSIGIPLLTTNSIEKANGNSSLQIEVGNGTFY